jgi:protein associated with RNAse G/E
LLFAFVSQNFYEQQPLSTGNRQEWYACSMQPLPPKTPSIEVMLQKENNKPHMQWQAWVIAANDEWMITLTIPGSKIQHHGKKFSYRLPHYCISLFSATDYYNIMLDFHKDGSFKSGYINIAEPARWNKNLITARDLDLDIIVSPDGHTTLVDEDEFQASVQAGVYTDSIIAIAESTAEHVMRTAQHNTFPFLRGTLSESLRTIRSALGN